MMAPAWMHSQISAEQYDSWSEEQCATIEIVDGMVIASPSASKRHNRLARILANALDAVAGLDWNADTDFDVRLQDGVPIVYTYVLDPATNAYRDGEIFTGTIKAAAPFSVTVDLGVI
ncbi:hypothetical protein [Streptomyces noursei]|uniref:hypothetical protein n=1 Tax=Streptomyces noursei TaxID=1971 RepID=UPI00381DD67E